MVTKKAMYKLNVIG